MGKLSHNNQHIELFDSYIHHKLDEGERTDFENRLNTDSEFKKEFELYCLLVDGIREKNRQDLKSYMNENKSSMYWGQNIWPRSVNYAAAAVLALFFVMYVMVKKYAPENQNSEMAIQTVPSIDTSKLPSMDEIMEDSTQLAINDASQILPPPNVQADEIVMFDKETIDPQEDLELESPMTKDDWDYVGTRDLFEKDATVLSDSKLKDTIVYLTVLDNRLDVGGNTYLFNSSTIKGVDISKSKAITPSNQANDDGINRRYKTTKKESTADTDDVNVKETKSNNDTIAIQSDKNEIVTLDSKKVGNNSQLKIELWSSPINFIGYSYTGDNLIKLYGMSKKSYQFYLYNQSIYMVYNSKVYAITYCSTACEFKELKDESIKSLILKQK